MAIQFDCPYCTSTLKVPDSSAGKQGDCPRCGTKLVIPNPIAADLQPSSPAENVAPSTQQQPVEPVPTDGQAVDSNPAVPIESPTPRPMTSMTAQYLRKRRKSNLGGMLLFVLFFGLMLGVAGYFYWAYGPNLEGNLVAARFESEGAKLELPVKTSSSGL
ncbi:MAG: hypothetical protein KDA77_17065, partial [Planctomycetaceae bacterium]|nr:hypothetical protein [Planctomycetaceae bacterium]